VPEGAAGSPHGEPAARQADVCACRAAVYHALALGFCEPTAAYVEALACGELVGGLREAVAWLRADAAVYDAALAELERAGSVAAESDGAEVLEGLAVEHARLFTGPGRPAVMCYATQYLDPDERRPWLLNGAATAYAVAAYRAEGVAPADSRRELPDHVTVELEFLFHLCRREEESWQRDERDEALRLRRALDTFLREHAAPFLTGFAGAVRDGGGNLASGGARGAGVDLYGALAELLAAHVAVELGEPPAGADVVGSGDTPPAG